jgi:phage terminase Nu1 subunit (DNA packaging protein)
MALITRKQAAEEMGVTIQAVYMAIKQGRLTAIKDNQGKIVINSDTMKDEWSKKTETKLINKIEHKTYKSSQSESEYPEYGESKARTEHLKAELLELERQEKEKSLVPVEEVNTMWQTIITNTRNKMLGVAAKAQQRLPDLDNSAVNCIDDIIREALEELASA